LNRLVVGTIMLAATAFVIVGTYANERMKCDNRFRGATIEHRWSWRDGCEVRAGGANWISAEIYVD
jgi:hypothetical protein